MFSLFGSDLEEEDSPLRCITQHPSFEMICLQTEVLETAIVLWLRSGADSNKSAVGLYKIICRYHDGNIYDRFYPLMLG